MDGPQVQDNLIKRRAHDLLPEISQFDYWARLEASVNKLQKSMDQLKEEQQNQNSMLCKLLREQEKQGREIQELKRQKVSLEEPGVLQIEGALASPNAGC